MTPVRTKRILILSLLFLAALLASVFVSNRSTSIEGAPQFDFISVSDYRFTEVFFDQYSVRVLVADNHEKRALGLGLLENLDEWDGMLFVFEKPTYHSFWMKGMKFPIDIFWLDHDGTIVYVQEDAHPDDYPEVYRPDQKAMYVLELAAGSAERFDFRIGDQFDLGI